MESLYESGFYVFGAIWVSGRIDFIITKISEYKAKNIKCEEQKRDFLEQNMMVQKVAQRCYQLGLQKSGKSEMDAVLQSNGIIRYSGK